MKEALRGKSRQRRNGDAYQDSRRWNVAFIWAVLFSSGLAGELRAQLATLPRCEDSVWEISSRHLPDNCLRAPLPELKFHRVVGGVWQASNQAEFSADAGCDSARKSSVARTIIYAHGNWTSAENARKRGWLLYQKLACMTDGPVRFIIYSWAADREHGFARDLLEKRAHLAIESYYLAQVIDCLDASEPLGLLGFSFGGAVVSGALHWRAGGALPRVPAQDENANRVPRSVRLTLIAPAFDCHALGVCGKFSETLSGVEQLVNLYNSTDPVLKRFKLVDRRESPVAAGFCGLISLGTPMHDAAANDSSGSRLAAHPKIQQFDCRLEIGRTHAEMAYLMECRHLQQGLGNLLGY